jgi:hypothetical protein
MAACPERAGKWSVLSLRLKTRLAKTYALKQGRMQELLTERVRLI